MTAARRDGRRGVRGQTATEYLMIAGLLTAMIIMVSNVVIPTLRDITRRLTLHMVVHLSSPARPEHEGPDRCPEFVEADPDHGTTCVE